MTELLFLSWRHLTRAERICLGVLALALAAWAVMPAIPQDQGYHAFADQRQWLGIPHAADVLSNLAFVLVGLFGITRLASRRHTEFPPATEAGLWFLALGFLGTGVGSAWYHLHPTDASLAWDRLPMTLVFTGLLGAAIAQRVGQNAARVSLALLFALGVASIVYWRMTGDLSLYVILQFGGIAALPLLLVFTRQRDDPIPWWWVIGWYGFAKLFEAGDHAIWQITNGLVAGHTLKHLAAAAAGAAALSPLLARPR
jgi:hypothetical protein